jgi:uncharacterized protein YndB with AHSA1/START domain
MGKEFEVRWDGEVPGTPQQVWDALTAHTAGWLWTIEYEPRVGGAERGLSENGGTVTAWDPPRHFATRSEDAAGLNELDYVLEPRGTGTYLRYTHRGVFAEDYDQQLDACQRHTAFYYHSLCEYVRHFAGRDAAYVSAEAPEVSAHGGFAALREALGVPADVTAGDRVLLTPAGLEPIDGVVDYVTDEFLGVRTADALYRCYGRDAWGWPVGVAHHLFAEGADEAASGQAWSAWLSGVFAADREVVG